MDECQNYSGNLQAGADAAVRPAARPGLVPMKATNQYRVEMVPASEIMPSPENEDIYGPITAETDSQIVPLVRQ
jgi:hypothetical protein